VLHDDKFHELRDNGKKPLIKLRDKSRDKSNATTERGASKKRPKKGASKRVSTVKGVTSHHSLLHALITAEGALYICCDW
jgi:hypothetical protein